MKAPLITLATLCTTVIAPAQGSDATAPKRSAHGARFWHLPIEVLALGGSRPPWPLEAFETDDGTRGLFVFAKRRETQLRLGGKENAGWKDLSFPMGLPSPIVLNGKFGAFLLGDLRDKRVRYHEVNIWDAKKLTQTDIEGPMPSNPMFSRLLVDARNRYALVGCERGQLLFSRSRDGGKTWTKLVGMGVNLIKDDQLCPPLMKTSIGLHVVHVAESGTLTHLLSKDEGKTWKQTKGQPRVADKFGAPMLVAGYGSRDDLHICCVTKSGAMVFHSSNDAGATWSNGVQVASNRLSDLASFFQLRGNGKVTVLCFTEPGKSGMHARRAHFFVTRDGGKTWAEAPVTEGVRGDTGRTCIFVNHRGRMLAAFSAGPKEGDEGKHHVLLRGYAGIGNSGKPMDKAKRAKATRLVRELSSDSVEAQDGATKELTAMGAIALPALLEAQSKAEATKAGGRIQKVIRMIQLTWIEDQEPPEWWQGVAR